MKILRDKAYFFPVYYSLQFDEETKMFWLDLTVAGVFKWSRLEWDFREMLRFLIAAQPHICGPKREFPYWETDDEQDSARWEYNYYRDLSKGFDGLYLTRLSSWIRARSSGIPDFPLADPLMAPMVVEQCLSVYRSLSPHMVRLIAAPLPTE